MFDAAVLKKAQSFRAAADARVCLHPCFLLTVALTASDTNVCTAVIRDGHNDAGEDMIDLAAGASGKDSRSYPWPMYFKKGLFVDVGVATSRVTGQYVEESDLA